MAAQSKKQHSKTASQHSSLEFDMVPPPNYHGNALALHEYMKSLPQDQFRNNPQALLNAIEDYEKRIQPLMTYSGAKLAATETVLAKLNPAPKILVELGGYVGVSAMAWAPMLQRLQQNQSSGIQVFSLELEAEFVKIIEDFVHVTGLKDSTRVVQGPSNESLRKLKEEGVIDNIDVLFIDHWEKFYVPDLRLCEELGLLKRGSVVVADNTDFPGAPDYLEYMRAGGEGGWKYRCEEVKVEVENVHEPSIVHFAYVEETP